MIIIESSLSIFYKLTKEIRQISTTTAYPQQSKPKKNNNNTCYCIDSIQDNWSRQQLQNKTTVKTTNFNRIIGFMCYAYDSTLIVISFVRTYMYMKIEILFRAISFRSSSFSVRYMSMCFFAIHHSIIEYFLSGHEFAI